MRKHGGPLRHPEATGDRRFHRRLPDVVSMAIAVVLSTGGSVAPAMAQTVEATPPADTGAVRDKPSQAPDIVVTGRRAAGSAIGDVAPVATFDAEAIRAIGATSMKELLERLKPLATAAGGGEPAILLNGRRVSGFADLQAIPPEAIEKMEILPEVEAARFGFPPTVRVMNFITKKRFRALTLQQLAGTTTEGGGETNYTEIASTRIDGPRRATLSLSYFRQNPILQSERRIVADPDLLYALPGNVTGIDGGSVDPRLDRLLGKSVSVVAVPVDPAVRRLLDSYVAGAGQPAITDIGAYRSLVQRTDMLNVNGSIGVPLGRTIDASLNLSVEAQRSAGTNGLATALVTVPGGGGYLPFGSDVLLYRYLPGDVLRQRGTSLNLHAGGTVQGGFGSWAWNATATYDRVRGSTAADIGIDPAALQAIVAAGGDPFAPFDRTADRFAVNRSQTVTGTVVGKGVLSGPLFRLPAGPAQVVIAADYARSVSTGRLALPDDRSLDLARTARGTSVNLTLPIAAAPQNVLAPLGRLNANGMIGVSDISDFGRLVSSSYGLTWAPARPVQFNASVNRTQSAPDIRLLTGPTLTTPNVPFFDFATGNSVLVTTVTGGNPLLMPERRRVTTLGLSLSPIRDRELRFNLDYVDTDIRNQSTLLGATTSPFRTAFPDRFTRDDAGVLTRVDLRSINIAAERERKLQLTANLFTQVGRKPPPPQETPPANAAPPKERLNLFAWVTGTLRIDNRVTLRPGAAALDLLGGETLTGSGGRPRWEIDGSIGGSMGPVNVGTQSRLQGPTRIRGDLAASDLGFSGRTWITLFANVEVSKLVARPWARNMGLQFTVENLLNDRIEVTDATGATPNRYQPAFLDPTGRSIRLGVRKQF